MFGLFKKKSKREILNKKYKQLIAEAHALSTRDRKASDLKMAEANAVLDEIDNLKE